MKLTDEQAVRTLHRAVTVTKDENRHVIQIGPVTVEIDLPGVRFERPNGWEPQYRTWMDDEGKIWTRCSMRDSGTLGHIQIKVRQRKPLK